jgi:hypothetical protein
MHSLNHVILSGGGGGESTMAIGWQSLGTPITHRIFGLNLAMDVHEVGSQVHLSSHSWIVLS